MDPVKKKHSEKKVSSHSSGGRKHRDSASAGARKSATGTETTEASHTHPHVCTPSASTTKDFIQANPMTTSGLGSSASVPETSTTGAGTPPASATATHTATAASALHPPTTSSLAPDMSTMVS